MGEQITNLSWLLEHVARKLEEVAARHRAEEEKGRGSPLTSKSVKEALLQAISLSGATGGHEAQEMLRELTKDIKE